MRNVRTNGIRYPEYFIISWGVKLESIKLGRIMMADEIVRMATPIQDADGVLQEVAS